MQRALSFTATVFAIPFRGVLSELSVNCALLKGENRSNRRDIATPVYLYIYIHLVAFEFDRDSHPPSLPLYIYYLLLIFPVNEISTARFFTDFSPPFLSRWILYCV